MSNEAVKHKYVSSANEPDMPIVNGQIICTNDKAGLSYDVGNHRFTMLSPTGDTQNNKVVYTSSDTANPTSLADMPAPMLSNQTHSTLFGKLSIAMRNLRYLISLIGSTDISGMDDGTITGNIDDLHNRIGFTGTTAEVQAAIQAGIITEGMTVTITDDYSNSAVNAAGVLADSQSSSTASRVFTAGEYMMYNNGFYKVTQDIASGGQIVVGTNVEATTIGAVLTELANKMQYPS